MREHKNLDVSAVHKKYPNIAKIFTREWFAEFGKEEEDMHLLARQFTYEEEDRISLHLIGHLEEYLETMQDEIKRNIKHFHKGLQHKKSYKSTLAEIEIGALFKNLGFQVELEPKIPGEMQKGDAIISDGATKIFIEVSTKEGPEINYKDKFDGVEVGEFKFQSPKTYKDKIEHKSNRQLSNFNPGILVLYLDPSCIPERRNIQKALYDGIVWMTNGEIVCWENGESVMDNTIISAILCYFHYFSDRCEIIKELYLNPKAKNPLPESIIIKFRDSGIEIKEEPIMLERNSP